MKAACSRDFALTLEVVGLDYQTWRTLASGATARRSRRTHWLRQFVRKVQHVHTGGGIWRGGQYCTKRQGGDPWLRRRWTS